MRGRTAHWLAAAAALPLPRPHARDASRLPDGSAVDAWEASHYRGEEGERETWRGGTNELMGHEMRPRGQITAAPSESVAHHRWYAPPAISGPVSRTRRHCTAPHVRPDVCSLMTAVLERGGQACPRGSPSMSRTVRPSADRRPTSSSPASRKSPRQRFGGVCGTTSTTGTTTPFPGEKRAMARYAPCLRRNVDTRRLESLHR
jgi:hypothetical protein